MQLGSILSSHSDNDVTYVAMHNLRYASLKWMLRFGKLSRHAFAVHLRRKQVPNNRRLLLRIRCGRCGRLLPKSAGFVLEKRRSVTSFKPSVVVFA